MDLNQIVPYVTHDTFSMYQVYRSTKHKTNPEIFLTMKISPRDLFQEWKTLPLFFCHMPVGLVVQSLFGWTCTKFCLFSWGTSTAFPFQELGVLFWPRREQQVTVFCFTIHNRHGSIHLVLMMCHVWDKTLNRLLPSFISVCKPNGVLQPFKITLTLISPDTILTTSPGHFSSLCKTTTQPHSLQLLFSASSGTVPETFY